MYVKRSVLYFYLQPKHLLIVADNNINNYRRMIGSAVPVTILPELVIYVVQMTNVTEFSPPKLKAGVLC